jgi:hypothetical protein
MMIQKRRILRNFILLGLMSYLSCFGSLLFADRQKKIVPTKQAPQKPPQIIPFRVHGKVLTGSHPGIGVKNIRVKLVPIQRYDRPYKTTMKARKDSTLAKGGKEKMKLAPLLTKTDENGRYSFHIDQKREGQKYRLIPRHPALPESKYYVPKHYDFVLSKSMAVNFVFIPPKLKVKARVKTPNNKTLGHMEVALHEVLGRGQYKHIKTFKTDAKFGYGTCTFRLLFENYYKKKVIIRARHPLGSPFGIDFTPKEKVFRIGFAETFVDFVYSGPLPDLTITPAISSGPNSIALTVSNKGNLKAGPFRFELWYGSYNNVTKEYTSYPRKKVWFKEGMEAGDSVLLNYSVSGYPQISARWNYAMVDRGNTVAESNENNNKWGHDD